MNATFKGDSVNKVDAKGRVSIPASFRRVLEAGDPSWTEGLTPNLVIVYGDGRRKYLEAYTIDAMNEVDAKIRKMPRGSKKRRALQRLYNGQAYPCNVDETGRVVLPPRLRAKLKIKPGETGDAYFIGNGDTFEIWNKGLFEEEAYGDLSADEDFDPNADPAIYLDGEEEE